MPSKEKLLTLANNWLADCEFIGPQIKNEIKPYYRYPAKYQKQIHNQLKLWDGIRIKWNLVILLKALDQMLNVSWSDTDWDLLPNMCTEPEIYDQIAHIVKEINTKG
jgi:hypothetical protein